MKAGAAQCPQNAVSVSHLRSTCPATQPQYWRVANRQGGVDARSPVETVLSIQSVEPASVEFRTDSSSVFGTLRYTADGSEPTAQSPEVRGPIPFRGTISVAAFSTTGRKGHTARLVAP